ncbi:hypothetical protein EVAR_15911_1 [Eumeta japonica]|uniref:Uncharacterized protein n=1 Tax=Eumeta variegata TaxID=151549 RepID=A0A4C1UL04_EUMVA|nr:hypothetical protein EVAR_15911_1 [Eumeta japonica]
MSRQVFHCSDTVRMEFGGSRELSRQIVVEGQTSRRDSREQTVTAAHGHPQPHSSHQYILTIRHITLKGGTAPGVDNFGPPGPVKSLKIDDTRKTGGALSSVSPGPPQLTVRPCSRAFCLKPCTVPQLK